eukprot:5921806-Amphidinium_carterae.1
MSSPWLANPKLEFVGHHCRALAINYNDSLSLQALTSDHDGMKLGFVYRLPTPWQRVRQLGSVSGDTTAALSVVRLSR